MVKPPMEFYEPSYLEKDGNPENYFEPHNLIQDAQKTCESAI